MDIKLGKPQEALWLPEFYVHTRPADLLRIAPIPRHVHARKSHFRVQCAVRRDFRRLTLLTAL